MLLTLNKFNIKNTGINYEIKVAILSGSAFLRMASLLHSELSCTSPNVHLLSGPPRPRESFPFSWVLWCVTATSTGPSQSRFQDPLKASLPQPLAPIMGALQYYPKILINNTESAELHCHLLQHKYFRISCPQEKRFSIFIPKHKFTNLQT